MSNVVCFGCSPNVQELIKGLRYTSSVEFIVVNREQILPHSLDHGLEIACCELFVVTFFLVDAGGTVHLNCVALSSPSIHLQLIYGV